MFKVVTQSTIFQSKVKPLFLGFVNVLVPSSCVFCRQLLDGSKPMGVCPACYGTLPVWSKDDVAMPPVPSYVDSFDAPYLYEDELKQAISLMKFNDKPEYGYALGELMCNKARGYKDVHRIIPVPMHKKRLFKRQYNQAALLAKPVAEALDVELSLFDLVRQKATSPQLGKSAKARKRNLSGAFKVNIHVEGEHILLIDDVWTTGSTAQACAKALKDAGALRVDVLTLCYVERPIYE